MNNISVLRINIPYKLEYKHYTILYFNDSSIREYLKS